MNHPFIHEIQALLFTLAVLACGTAPVCSPSRAGLMTGRYQQRFGHYNNIVTESANPIAHTPTDETLLPQVLAKAGYHTAMIAKWHLGQQDGCRPYEHGFQEFFGIITGGHDYFINHPDERAIGDSQYKARIERNGPVGEKVPVYLTDAFGDDAVRVIRESHSKRPDQPLFLYLAFKPYSQNGRPRTPSPSGEPAAASPSPKSPQADLAPSEPSNRNIIPRQIVG